MDTNYSPTVAQLLTFGDCRNFREWSNYLELGIGPEHTPELIKMATDQQLNWPTSEGLEMWAPVHAWRALGQLRATEAIEPLLPLLQELDDNDWAGEELPQVYGMIGRAAIPALVEYVADPTHELWPRITAAHAIEEIAAADPSARAECVAVLSQQLERCADNDPVLNGFLISYLLDLQAVEALPLMEQAFAGNYVDLSIAGDLEDIQMELGLRTERETQPSYKPLFSLEDLVSLTEKPEPAKVKHPNKTAVKAKNKRKQSKAGRKANRKRK